MQICAFGAYAHNRSLNELVKLSSWFRYIKVLLARRLLDIPIQILVDVLFIMLINVKLPTIVGILTFISTINFVLS